MRNLVAIILQARNKSTRLPGKVMKDLGGRPLLHFLLERLKRCEKIDEIFIATTSNQEDNSIEELARNLDCKNSSKVSASIIFLKIFDFSFLENGGLNLEGSICD